jgi:transcriptional regulator with XRE-family HTH domain
MPKPNVDLKAIRESRGLTRTELAKMTRINISTIRSAENGDRNPSRYTLLLLYSALKIEPTEEEKKEALLQDKLYRTIVQIRDFARYNILNGISDSVEVYFNNIEEASYVYFRLNRWIYTKGLPLTIERVLTAIVIRIQENGRRRKGTKS